MDLSALFNLSPYQISDQKAMQALWLKTAFERYGFLQAGQWWQFVYPMPWEAENSQTWLAKSADEAMLKGFAVVRDNQLLVLCIAPECEKEIAHALLERACASKAVWIVELFLCDEDHHSILSDYGFEVTQEQYNCLFSQTIVKMSLHHS